MSDKLALIGRDRVLIDKLAKELHGKTYHLTTPIYETARGCYFEVAITLKGKPHERIPTGHVARVTVELDRIEPSPETLLPKETT